ncbi:MAG: 3-phosphoshikimate 1-carboxyvinyltransferase [Gemmataceae bacterium]
MMAAEYPAELAIVPVDRPIQARVRVPGSKSITNRALALAALSQSAAPCELTGALHSEDTEVMLAALQELGYAVQADWPAERIHFPMQPRTGVPRPRGQLFVANSGTSMRFLTALVATGTGTYRLDGIPRMRERPIADLLDALNQLPGVEATSEAGTGCPPVVVRSTGLKGGTVRMRADLSSQFLSALLMAAPHAESALTIELDGPVVSEPYIQMTLAMMREWGYRVEVEPGVFRVQPGRAVANPARYAIEPDASSASYFWAAAAITGGTVTVEGLHRGALQGDVNFVDALAQMGATVTENELGLTVQGGPLVGITIDMNAISDTVMTLAAVACFADGPTRIHNVAHIRHKETDRLQAMATELHRLGAMVIETEDSLTIHPGPLRGCAVDTYNDHRMAMSLALVGLRTPGVVIRDPGCVAKTYIRFWGDFARLGAGSRVTS